MARNSFRLLSSLDRVRFLVLTPPPQFEKWELKRPSRVKAPAQRTAAAACRFARARDAGGYRLTKATELRLPGADEGGESLSERSTPAVPWENCPFGRDWVVIPPFGRWWSTSAGLRQLRAPASTTAPDCGGRSPARSAVARIAVRLEIETGARRCAAGGSVTFTDKAADHVRGQVSWSRPGPEPHGFRVGIRRADADRPAARTGAVRVDAMQLAINGGRDG